MFFFFFFQAEDGIRDLYVTGVQTCALPISGPSCRTSDSPSRVPTRRTSARSAASTGGSEPGPAPPTGSGSCTVTGPSSRTPAQPAPGLASTCPASTRPGCPAIGSSLLCPLRTEKDHSNGGERAE